MSGMRLKTTVPAFETIHRLADGKGDTRKIAKQALLDLLMDHSIMVARLEQMGVKAV